MEQTYLDILKAVKSEVTIPVAVKLSPFFSNFANMAKRLDDAGANGLVLFNRFYQPDIDLETLEVRPNILLSTPMAMRVPLRWMALLFGRIRASLAATSGIHRASDVLKMLMAGADVTMLCSVLIRHGIPQIAVIERDLGRLDGGARIHLRPATARQLEPEELRRPERLRARPIHARPRPVTRSRPELDAGYWILDAGCSIPATRYWMKFKLKFEVRSSKFEVRIAEL